VVLNFKVILKRLILVKLQAFPSFLCLLKIIIVQRKIISTINFKTDDKYTSSIKKLF